MDAGGKVIRAAKMQYIIFFKTKGNVRYPFVNKNHTSAKINIQMISEGSIQHFICHADYYSL